MKRKRKSYNDDNSSLPIVSSGDFVDVNESVVQEAQAEEPVLPPIADPVQPVISEQQNLSDHPKKFKSKFTRVSVDPNRKYYVPDSRESWGPNVKGKKFRKEKGKKKRCPNAGLRIDGSVKSKRLDV